MDGLNEISLPMGRGTCRCRFPKGVLDCAEPDFVTQVDLAIGSNCSQVATITEDVGC